MGRSRTRSRSAGKRRDKEDEKWDDRQENDDTSWNNNGWKDDDRESGGRSSKKKWGKETTWSRPAGKQGKRRKENDDLERDSNRVPHGRERRCAAEDDEDLGVELSVVCDDIPVLKLEESSVLNQNASWILQTVLGCTSKAHTLYEYSDDDDDLAVEAIAECEKFGFTPDDIGIVFLKRNTLREGDRIEGKWEELRTMRAVGTNGKRSIMLAVVVAVMLRLSGTLGAAWKDLKEFGLDRPVRQLMDKAESIKHRIATEKREAAAIIKREAERRERDERERQAEWERREKARRAPAPDPVPGIDLDIVSTSAGDPVPVLSLDKDSPFHESASWLLQSALGASGKADALYEHSEDKYILSQCYKLGLTDRELALVNLRREDLRHISAIGTVGKRSVLLSVVLALALHDALAKEFMAEMWEYDQRMYKLFEQLLAIAKHLSLKRDTPFSFGRKGRSCSRSPEKCLERERKNGGGALERTDGNRRSSRSCSQSPGNEREREWKNIRGAGEGKDSNRRGDRDQNLASPPRADSRERGIKRERSRENWREAPPRRQEDRGRITMALTSAPSSPFPTTSRAASRPGRGVGDRPRPERAASLTSRGGNGERPRPSMAASHTSLVKEGTAGHSSKTMAVRPTTRGSSDPPSRSRSQPIYRASMSPRQYLEQLLR